MARAPFIHTANVWATYFDWKFGVPLGVIDCRCVPNQGFTIFSGPFTSGGWYFTTEWADASAGNLSWNGYDWDWDINYATVAEFSLFPGQAWSIYLVERKIWFGSPAYWRCRVTQLLDWI